MRDTPGDNRRRLIINGRACHHRRVYFTDIGSGFPLVLLHAFPVDSTMWRPALDTLSEHARVITPDQRGFGRTALDFDGPVPEPSLAVPARDVVNLLERLDLRAVVIGGCSMGGYVAMRVLEIAADRVAGLLFVDTKATADDGPSRDNRLATAERADGSTDLDWLSETMLPRLVAPGASVGEDLTRTIRRQSPASVAWAQRAMAVRPDSTALLREQQLPTLVVHGECDAIIPVDTAEALRELIPGSRMVTVPGAGHLVPLEEPAVFAAAVAGWLPTVL